MLAIIQDYSYGLKRMNIESMHAHYKTESEKIVKSYVALYYTNKILAEGTARNFCTLQRV